jgi:hypothetical protein
MDLKQKFGLVILFYNFLNMKQISKTFFISVILVTGTLVPNIPKVAKAQSSSVTAECTREAMNRFFTQEQTIQLCKNATAVTAECTREAINRFFTQEQTIQLCQNATAGTAECTREAMNRFFTQEQTIQLCKNANYSNNNNSTIPDDYRQLSTMINSSYQEVFGRDPSTEETKYWVRRSQSESLNRNRLIEYHRQWLKGGGDLDGTIIRSYKAVLARQPNRGEINYWRERIRQSGEIYTDLLEVHEQWRNGGGR